MQWDERTRADSQYVHASTVTTGTAERQDHYRICRHRLRKRTTDDRSLLGSFNIQSKLPRLLIDITTQVVYTHNKRDLPSISVMVVDFVIAVAHLYLYPKEQGRYRMNRIHITKNKKISKFRSITHINCH
jgi:hypothetical protein